MDEREQPASGFWASLRRLAATALGTMENRVELFALELQEEKLRLISLLLWTAATVFFGILAIVGVGVTIVMLSPTEAQPYVLVGLCLLALALTAVATVGLKKQLQEKPPLSETISELKKDVEWLRSRE